jgi:hypothetical protein
VKKMDKDTKTRKLGSHQSHDKRRRTISVVRNHHHSPKNSTRRTHIISIPSPIKKHKKKFGMYEL